MDKVFFVTEPRVGVGSVHFVKEGANICACGCGIKGTWVVDREDALALRDVLEYAGDNARVVCAQCLTNVVEAGKRGIIK